MLERRKRILLSVYARLLLLLLTQYHLACLPLTEGYWLEPPNRTLPAELIVLENGSTTFVSSSLEEFLESTTIKASPAPTEPKKVTHQSLSIIPHNDQLERESGSSASVSGQRQNTNHARAEEDHHRKPSNLDEKDNHNKKQSILEKASGHHGGGGASGSGNSSAPKPIPQHWQVKSLLNVTHDYPLEYSQIICGYVWPLMAAITLFTNLMIVFVLTQRDMRTPTNVVLTAIAIADIIPIVVPVPWFVYLFAMGNEKQVLYPPITCYFYQHSTRSVSEIFYFLSTWLNVLLAIQDYLTACWPKLAKKYCQIKVVIIEIVALTLLAFLLNLPQALKLVFKPVKFYYNGQLTWGCRALQAKWFKDLVGEYVALYDDIFTAIIVVFVDGGPAIALIVLTALLIRQLHRQRIQGHLLMEQARTASKRRRERHRQQEYEASARVMIFVLLAFLAVKIPFATTYTLMIIQSRFEIHFVENLVDFQKAITLTDLVFVLSYPINFTIFCGCSKKFRHKCAQLLGECNQNTKTAKNRLMSSFNSSFNSETSQVYPSNNQQNNYDNKRGSSGTVLSANRDSSAGLLQLVGERGKLQLKGDSMSTTGSVVCCNGYERKLSQPQTSPSYNQPPARDDRQPQQRPSPILEDATDPQDDVRALAEDGLCVECIMRYEQMKRSSGSLATSHHSMQLQQQQQHHQQRRLSVDSDSSWHVTLPPLPPPLQYSFVTSQQQQQQQLPHIVTTRCESIRERPGSQEGNQEPPMSSTEFRSHSPPKLVGRSQAVDCQSQMGSSVFIEQLSITEKVSQETLNQAAVADSGLRGRIQSRGVTGSSARGSSDPGTVRSGLRQQSLGYDYLDEHYHTRGGRSASHSNESMSSTGRGDETDEGRSRRAGGDSTGDERGKHRSRGPTLKQIENKHRSMSMSNSKLSALAGATGLLADIIKSTLLTTNATPSSSQQHLHHHQQPMHFTFNQQPASPLSPPPPPPPPPQPQQQQRLHRRSSRHNR